MNAVINANPWQANNVWTILLTHGSSIAGADDGTGLAPAPSICARMIVGKATAIGARKPVPTHIGNKVSPAGARSPQPWVNVRASSMATASMKKVRMLSASMLGSATRLLLRNPTGAPEIQAILRARYGRLKTMAAYPAISRMTPLRTGSCISITSLLSGLSFDEIESEHIKRFPVRDCFIHFGIKEDARVITVFTAYLPANGPT